MIVIVRLCRDCVGNCGIEGVTVTMTWLPERWLCPHIRLWLWLWMWLWQTFTVKMISIWPCFQPHRNCWDHLIVSPFLINFWGCFVLTGRTSSRTTLAPQRAQLPLPGTVQGAALLVFRGFMILGSNYRSIRGWCQVSSKTCKVRARVWVKTNSLGSHKMWSSDSCRAWLRNVLWLANEPSSKKPPPMPH